MSVVGARFNPFSPKAQAKASGFFGGGDLAPARFGAGGPGASSMTTSPGAGAGAGAGAVSGGGGAAGSGFGQGVLGLSSLEEKEEEEAAVSPMNGDWSGGGVVGNGGAEGSRPASFERLRQAGS